MTDPTPSQTPHPEGNPIEEEPIHLEPEFKNLNILIDACIEGKKPLTNANSLRVAHQKGLYPYEQKMRQSEYEDEKRKLQAELLKVQKWVKTTGQQIIILFEGRDAAGKGGVIQRFMEHLNPRAANVVALETPTERERGQWYFQRYINNFPTQGEMVFFDRSWYNRPGVEHVMDFCTLSEYHQFLRQCPLMERMITNSGIRLFKYWFSISRLEQLLRFYCRKTDPLKQWKLSTIDLKSLDKWDHYTRAKEAMFFHTDTQDAPWTIIKSDDKKRARINCLRHFLHSLDYPHKDLETTRPPDPQIVINTEDVYDKNAHSSTNKISHL